jgi:GH24 family phage-related lysozyme (muramidase)
MSNEEPINFLDLFTSYRALPHQKEALRVLEATIPPNLLTRDSEWYKIWNPPKQDNSPDWLPQSLEIIKEFEDCKLEAFESSEGEWTIGWGSTQIHGRPVRKGDKISQDEADFLLKSEIQFRAKELVKLLPIMKGWSGNRISALLSWAYNVGSGAVRESTLRKRLLNGEDPVKVVSEELPRWNKGKNNIVLPGLVRRRAAEVELFVGKQIQQPEVPTTKPPLTVPERAQWVTKIKALNLSQPDEETCQAACIAMAVGDKDIARIRNKLLAEARKVGQSAGSPSVMATVIRSYGRPYKYEGNASMNEVYSWLKDGEFLITHGWFTSSGHVICLDGLKKNPNGSFSIDVKDPWSEFNAPIWKYDINSKFYDGFYSDKCIYAACVEGTSLSDSFDVYKAGKLNLNQKGMWVHRFLTSAAG